MKTPRTKPSLLFRMIVPATIVFIMTILILIAVLFGDPDAPISKWLNDNGNHILFFELIAVVVLAFVAMAVDRFNTLRGIDEEPFQPATTEPPEGAASE